MSGHIDTSDGTWREAREGEKSQLTQWIDLPDGNKTTRRWVRVEPVPTLPTAQDTVINVTWAKGARSGVTDRLWLAAEGCWIDSLGTQFNLASEGIITDWKTLARPVGKVRAEDEDAYYDSDDIVRVRRDTAKAVLDRVRRGSMTYISLDVIAREFGVDA